jgi:hypothetical protein
MRAAADHRRQGVRTDLSEHLKVLKKLPGGPTADYLLRRIAKMGEHGDAILIRNEQEVFNLLVEPD